MSKKKPPPKKPRSELAVEFMPTTPKANGLRTAEPFPLTMQEEMALAIILWRAVRFSYRNEKAILEGPQRTTDAAIQNPRREEEVNDTALEMAKRMGVKEEFFAWLWKFPVFKLYLAGLDPWPDSVKGIVPPDREVVVVDPPRISYLRSNK